MATRGGQLAIVVAAVLVAIIGLAAAGAFGGCGHVATQGGRPSMAVSSSPYGAVGYATAKVFAKSIHPRQADTQGEIRGREFITGAFQQYGFFPRVDEFIAGRGARRVHSANVVAIKEGESAKRLIVGAHYDSVAAGEGYSDNATGVGLLLETAARIKGQATPYTVVFVAFGANKKGSLGAKDYLRTLDDVERRAVIGMIDLDAVAGGDELSVSGRVGAPTWLRDDALSAAAELEISLATSPAEPGRPAGDTLAPGDDLVFAQAGIATASFSAVSWRKSRGAHVVATSRGDLWDTGRDTVAGVEQAYPGRAKAQISALSRLLETLLTSELKRRP